MPADLVLAVIKDRDWTDIDCFALSLAKTGFKGQKVILAENLSRAA